MRTSGAPGWQVRRCFARTRSLFQTARAVALRKQLLAEIENGVSLEIVFRTSLPTALRIDLCVETRSGGLRVEMGI